MRHIIRAPLLIFAPVALVAAWAMARGAMGQMAFAPSDVTTLVISNGSKTEFYWPEVQKCAQLIPVLRQS
jgi:hypothetical protein